MGDDEVMAAESQNAVTPYLLVAIIHKQLN